MKKLLTYLVSLITLTSCSIYGYDVMYYTDFSRYLDNGFIISPVTDFNGKSYDVLGELVLKHSDGSMFANVKSEQEYIDSLVIAAKLIGGNGIIGYKSKYIPGSKYNYPYSLYSGIVVSFKDVSINSNHIEINNSFITGEKEYKIYDYEKAISITQEKNITLIGYTKKEGLKVYFDPDISQYLLEDMFIRKYGYETIEKLSELE